jgi:hypothetical protein
MPHRADLSFLIEAANIADLVRSFIAKACIRLCVHVLVASREYHLACCQLRAIDEEQAVREDFFISLTLLNVTCLEAMIPEWPTSM